MKRKIDNIKKLILFTFLTTNIFASDVAGLNVSDLLDNIEKKTDLSQKTKLENGGVSFIFTRDDLERMQAKSLKDVLKTTYPFGYNENIYGRPDPLTFGTTAPFLSSMMRIFIDNQEVTAGIYGSGIAILGDIDLGFVNHIEVYTQNPTYEYSTEATMVLVKIYTRVAQKDEGGKVELNYGSYGSSGVNGFFSQELDEWSYFSYISHSDINRKKYYSNASELSRDRDRTHILTSLYNDNNRILVQGIRSKEDAFIGKSIDATPIKNTNDLSYLHVGYDGKSSDVSFLATYDYISDEHSFLDDIGLISSREVKLHSHIATAELKYDYITSSNKLVTGLKYRYKKYDYDKRYINGISQPKILNTSQTIATVFLENQYSLEENSILTFGISTSEVKNNNSPMDADILMYRVGHTYTTDNWVFKTIGSHVEIPLDPYLVKSPNSYTANANMKAQSLDTIIENIIYTNKNNKYELIFGRFRSENYVVPTAPYMRLDNYSGNIRSIGAHFRWTHEYNRFDKFFVSFGYTRKGNMPFPLPDTVSDYIGVLRDIKTYEKFDIFNELLYFRDSIDSKNFYDYSAGVKYHHSEDFTISIKGENLFDKSRVTKFNRVDVTTLANPMPSFDTPIEVSSIDRKVTLSLEYLF